MRAKPSSRAENNQARIRGSVKPQTRAPRKREGSAAKFALSFLSSTQSMLLLPTPASLAVKASCQSGLSSCYVSGRRATGSK